MARKSAKSDDLANGNQNDAGGVAGSLAEGDGARSADNETGNGNSGVAQVAAEPAISPETRRPGRPKLTAEEKAARATARAGTAPAKNAGLSVSGGAPFAAKPISFFMPWLLTFNAMLEAQSRTPGIVSEAETIRVAGAMSNVSRWVNFDVADSKLGAILMCVIIGGQVYAPKLAQVVAAQKPQRATAPATAEEFVPQSGQFKEPDYSANLMQ